MTTNELAEHLAAVQNITKADAKKHIETFLAAIGDAVAKGEDVSLNGFGKFTSKRTPERQGLNPATKEVITIKAATRIGFKAAKLLKDKVNR